MFKRVAFLTFVFLCLSLAVFGQEKNYSLYYYGVLTNVNDQNMLSITQDLFAAQLRRIPYVSVVEERDSAIKSSYAAVASDTEGAEFFRLAQGALGEKGDALLFFTRIYRAGVDEKWECTFFAKNPQSGVVASRSRQYESYYKILSDAKSLIQEVVAKAAGRDSEEGSGEQALTEGAAPKVLNTESIAGTWSGEKGVSQVTIMRGGRGFIVFSNGAVMNAKVFLVSEGGVQKLRIVQQDRFNASYYPDIDRKTILGFAESAAPIEWNLTMTAQGTLEGTKRTLALSGGAVEPVSQKVVWTRR